MKAKSTSTLLALGLALAWALLPVLRADDTPPAKTAPAEQAAPADTKAVDQAKPDLPPAPPVPPEAAKPAEVAKPAAGTAAATKDETPEEKTVEPEKTEPETPAAAEPAPEEGNTKGHRSRAHHTHGANNERVSFFSDSTLAAGEHADAVVSILGSSTSAGEVGDAVVSIFGSSTTSGNVGNAVVSVVGSTRVTSGTVGDAAVAVFGNTYVNGHVRGEVVAVLGNIELGPNAVVDGEMVCVGGQVIRDAKAIVHGNVQNIAIGGHNFNFEGLQAWFSRCLLFARPLAWDVRVLWAWCIALAFLGFYALVALIAPEGVAKCVQTLEERPGKSILAALLTMLLTPVAYVLLVLTLAIAIGVVLIPLFSLGLFIAGVFGKVVMLAWLGRRILKLFRDGPIDRPVIAVLIGGVMVLVLYTVPILGFVVYKLMGLLGLGVVIYTLLLSSRNSRREAAAAKAAEKAAAASAAAAATPPPVMGEVAVAPAVPMLPPILSASTLERAGFWIRLAAALLDCVMVGIVFGMLHRLWMGFGGVFPFWYAVYCVVLWATKGTTIGGIICGLKIVRLDDRPVDWGVAVVRALGGFLSLAVAGLGFIWVAFDNEKQSWHDKIAGTTIVKVPKGTPLL
jgi:uncharacterized RDD family membrane protein YckC